MRSELKRLYVSIPDSYTEGLWEDAHFEKEWNEIKGPVASIGCNSEVLSLMYLKRISDKLSDLIAIVGQVVDNTKKPTKKRKRRK